MPFADFAALEAQLEKINCPASRAIFAGARLVKRSVEFIEPKDLYMLVGHPMRSTGVFIDRYLSLVHSLQNARPGRDQVVCACTNLVRASLEISTAQFIYVFAPGYRPFLLIIPSQDLLTAFFSDKQDRAERSVRIPCDLTAGNSVFPFWKYVDQWGAIPA